MSSIDGISLSKYIVSALWFAIR